MMPHTAPAIYTRRQDDAYLPARVARRMIARHGAEIALLRADTQRLKHKHRMRPEAMRRNTPFLIIYWDIVCVFINRRLSVPLPVESAA
jgi:hypothetical protein